jgi:hypothetical protein
MHDAAAGATLDIVPWLNAVPISGPPGQPGPSNLERRQETGMERTDWLDEGLSPADARFLMLTAITHHQFSSPAWGEHEVRKLHAELAELDRLVTAAVPPGPVKTR